MKKEIIVKKNKIKQVRFHVPDTFDFSYKTRDNHLYRFVLQISSFVLKVVKSYEAFKLGVMETWTSPP